MKLKLCDPDRPDVTCFSMKSGSAACRPPNAPEISLVRGGPRRTYLWVGNDRRNEAGEILDGGCFATLSRPAALRALAEAILEEFDRPKKRKRKRKGSR